jgi:hypothetical protein
LRVRLVKEIMIIPPPAGRESAYRGPCPILNAHVTRDTRAGTTRVFCHEYCEPEGVCQLKKAALDSSSGSIAPEGTACVMLTA